MAGSDKKDAPIVILDEPTAPLDAATEHQVMDNLAKWGQGRAIFIITHRLSTVRALERLIQEGRPEINGQVWTPHRPARPDKWEGGKADANFAKLARLTTPKDDTPRLILWPEAAVPDYLETGYPAVYYDRSPAAARGRLTSLMNPGDVMLLGALKLELDRTGEAVGARNAADLMRIVLSEVPLRPSDRCRHKRAVSFFARMSL